MSLYISEKIRAMQPFWDEWYIDGFLGEGSYGQVFSIKKTDESGEYTSALKWIQLPATSQSDPGSMDRNKRIANSIEKEIQLLAKLGDNNYIVGYKDHKIIVHEDGSRDIFIRMEKLISLNAYLRNHSIKKREIIKLGIDICEALILCQRVKIIHQDIKPDNIFVARSGYKLGDFGIARPIGAKSEISRGTMRYMAPEVHRRQADGTCTTDLYSLGIVLYHLLNDGRGPFEPDIDDDISLEKENSAIKRRLRGDILPPPKHEHGRLWEIISKACSFRAKERYSSADMMKRDLDSIKCDDEEAELIESAFEIMQPGSMHNLSTDQSKNDSLQTEINVITDEINVIADDIITPPPPAAEQKNGADKADEFPVQPPVQKKWGLIAAAVGTVAVLLFVGIYFGLLKGSGTITVLERTKTSIAVMWSRFAGNGSYTVECTPVGNTGYAAAVACKDNRIKLDNLIPGIKYTIAVKSDEEQKTLTANAETLAPEIYGKDGTLLSRIDINSYYYKDASTESAFHTLIERGDMLYALDKQTITMQNLPASKSAIGYVVRAFVTCSATSGAKNYTAQYVLKTGDGKQLSVSSPMRIDGNHTEYCLYEPLGSLLDMYYSENGNAWNNTEGTITVYIDGDRLGETAFHLSVAPDISSTGLEGMYSGYDHCRHLSS